MGEKTRPAIRIFISSTFLDMQSERKILNQEVFPKLKTKCENLGVSFYVVDLRWGITEEEQKQDSVVDICLREIDNCRPFFIGLIGNRYGWIPTKYGTNTLRSFPWLAGYEGKSVTEVEMCYGALDCSDDRVLFYFKEEALAVCEESDNKVEEIRALKERVLTSGKYCKPYFSVQAFGEDVYNRLSQMIDSLYNNKKGEITEIKQKYFLSKEREAYVKNEIFERVYFDFLRAYPGKPLLIYSPNPCGKSITLNNWVAELKGESVIINLKCDTSLADHPYKLFNLIIDGLTEKGIELTSDFFEYGDYFDRVDEADINDFAYLRDLLSKLQPKKDLYLVLNDIEVIFQKPVLHSLSFIPSEFSSKLHILCSSNNAEQTSLLRAFGFVYVDIEKEAVKLVEQVSAGQVKDIDLSTFAKNMQIDFFPRYLSFFGKSTEESFSETNLLSVYNQKLVADFLIQFSNFESYKTDFNLLVYGHKEKGKALGDTDFILKNAFDLLTYDYDDETLYYLSVLMVRLKNMEYGVDESELFVAFPDEGDTLSLLAFCGSPKYKENISPVKKALVIKVLRFFFKSDEGRIKNKDTIVKHFIDNNALYFAKKALAYKKGVLEENFSITKLGAVNLGGKLILKEDFGRIFLTDSELMRILDYDFSDMLTDYFDRRVKEVEGRLDGIEDFMACTEENNRLEEIISQAIRFFTVRNHPTALHNIVTSRTIVLFMYIRNKYLLQTALFTYLGFFAKGQSEERCKREMSRRINDILARLEYDYFDDYKGDILNCYLNVINAFSLDLVDFESLSNYTDTIYFCDMLYRFIEDFATEDTFGFFESYNQLEAKAKRSGLDEKDSDALNGIYAETFRWQELDSLVDKFVYNLVACRISLTFSLKGNGELFRICCDTARWLSHPLLEATALSLFARYMQDIDIDLYRIFGKFARDFFVLLANPTETARLK